MIVPLGIMYNALNNNNNPSTQPQFQSITIPITKSLSISTTIFIKTFIPNHFRTNEEHQHTIKLMEVGGSGPVCFEDVLGSRSALLLFVEHLESELIYLYTFTYIYIHL